MVALRIILAVLTLALAALASPSSAAPDPVETRCVADEAGTAHCSTTVARTCTVSTIGGASPSLACDLPGDSAAAPPALPCQSGIAGSWCTVGAFDCKATVGYQTGGPAYQYAGAYCGRDLWYPCVVAYADTRGNVESCLVATTSASAAADPTQVCTAGFAQTWCDFTVGPCDVRVTPWTAWGDQSVVADCRVGGGAGATCHTEVHMQDPLDPEHWCAW